MGNKNEKREVAICYGELKACDFSGLTYALTLEPDNTVDLSACPMSDSADVEFQVEMPLLRSCRTRKRFIKLMMGVFGVPRNRAKVLARAAMLGGRVSYTVLWMYFCLTDNWIVV